MKHLLLFIAAFAALTFTACNDDDLVAPVPAELDSIVLGDINVDGLLFQRIPAGYDSINGIKTYVRTFDLGRTEVTNAQYCQFLNAIGVGSDGKVNFARLVIYDEQGDSVMNNTAFGGNDNQELINPKGEHMADWGLQYTGSQWQPVSGKDNYPVTNVTWFGAKLFAYCTGHKLPTETQWQYAAARIERDTHFSLDDAAWYTNNSDNLPQEVGQKSGDIKDIFGNVSEWCNDDLAGLGYPDSTNIIGVDSLGHEVVRDDNNSLYRSVRGGCYKSADRFCNATHRGGALRSQAAPNVGFRIVK